ncbi:Uu.00g045600.m01.CDS01 [Anthostomella pinea]|uniref:Uu.00g045600.m01.CDS01 n=1 Tax=Anthostomella pinea TaxID=933095 RepID=A0AAI8YEF5_9PEZI|nr:Uu.00g045600.m01.CDS01 [Anthostomella pinea]
MHFLAALLLPLSGLLITGSHGFGVSHAHQTREQPGVQVPNNAMPPSQDPWYTAPAGFETAAPGTILRIRTDPSNITAVLDDCVAAYNILYRTTDARYAASWAVTTLLVPREPVGGSNSSSGNNSSVEEQEKKSALLSYQIWYNTASVDGSPSYLLSTSFASNDMIGIPPATEDIGAALARGWFVVVPDFEGPLAAFGAGPQAAHAVLDSVRAVFESDAFPGERMGEEGEDRNEGDTRVALWGYSGGSLASTFAAERQTAYAPKVRFAGMAIGGLVPNLTEVLHSLTNTALSGLAPQLLLGLTAEFPAARAFLVSQLNAYNASTFLAALNLTRDQSIVAYANQDIGAYFAGGSLETFLAAPEMARVIANNGVQGHHGIPQMPVFAYEAIADQASHIASSDDLIDIFCALDVNVLYQRNTVGDHGTEVVNGQPRALAFLDAVLGGLYGERYNATGCTWQDVTVDVAAS